MKANTNWRSRQTPGLLSSLLLLTSTIVVGSELELRAEIHLHAQMFHAGSGTLSSDVLAAGGPELGNVVAGDNPSTSTLVIAEISLAPDQVISSDAQVALLARESATPPKQGRVLLERSVDIGAIRRGGKIHIGFWLDGTGCMPLELHATVRSKEDSPLASTKTTIPFICYE